MFDHPYANHRVFLHQVVSKNGNSQTTSLLSSPAFCGKLAKPATPVLEWILPGGQASPYAELQFEAPADLPARVTPLYWYKLFDETGQALPAYSNWVAIAIGGEAGASGTGASADKFKYNIWTATPGEYKAQVSPLQRRMGYLV